MDSHTTNRGLKSRLVRYVLQSFRLATTIPVHKVERSMVCVEGRGRISRLCLTQDIKMGRCVFQCDVSRQWIAQRQVGPVSVYCDLLGCHVLCLRHGIPVWQHIGQSTTAGRRHRRDMTLYVRVIWLESLQITWKGTLIYIYVIIKIFVLRNFQLAIQTLPFSYL